jgi:DNA-binding CsgD family transcriptional regulator
MGAELKALEKISAAIATADGVARLLAQIVCSAARLCKAPIALVTVLAAGEQLEILAAHSRNEQLVGRRMQLAATVHSLVISSNQSRRGSGRPVPRSLQACLVPGMSGIGDYLVLPLRKSDGAFGTLALARHRLVRFTAGDEAIARCFAEHASIAIQQAELRRQLIDRLPRAAEQPSDASPMSLAVVSDSGGDPAPLRGCDENAAGLSPRQGQIVQLLMAGKTAKEIGAALNLSTRTVEHHLERLKLRFKQPRLHALVGYLADRYPTPRLGACQPLLCKEPCSRGPDTSPSSGRNTYIG